MFEFHVTGRCKAILRPSLLSTTSSGPSSVGLNSRAGFNEGSVGGGGGGSLGGDEFNCESATTSSFSAQSPVRTRHIKLRNKLLKNNSVGKLRRKKLDSFVP